MQSPCRTAVLKGMAAAGLMQALVLVTTPAQATEIRILTGDPGTSQTGSWSPATGASMRLEGRSGLYAISGSGATYTFAPALPETTEYAVEVFNNCYS